MDNRILKAIANIESNNSQWALRFEPQTYLRKIGFDKSIVDAIRAINKCSKETANMIYSTSFGAWQLMGFNVYDKNCEVSVGQFLSDRYLQEEAIKVYIKRRKLDFYTIDGLQDGLLNVAPSEAFAKKYNGPGNVVEYGKRLREALEKVVKEG